MRPLPGQGLTWAWFSVSVTAKPQSLIAANFDVAVEVTGASSDALITPEESGYYALAAGAYRITLNRAGTSEKIAGYCLIKIGGCRISFGPLVLNEPLTFTLALDTEKAVGFTPVWGTRDGEPVRDGDTITITEQGQTTEPSAEPTEAAGTESTAASEATTPRDPPLLRKPEPPLFRPKRTPPRHDTLSREGCRARVLSEGPLDLFNTEAKIGE